MNITTEVATMITANNVKVYPNPTTNIINIDALVHVTAVISSIDGQVLLQVLNAKTIDISNLANGMYLLHLTNQGEQLIYTTWAIKVGH